VQFIQVRRQLRRKHGWDQLSARALPSPLSNADAARTEQVGHLDVARLVGPHEAMPHCKVRHDQG
jgi:hypothetical protein